MNQYMIITEDTSDLPEDYINEHNLGMVSLSCSIDGERYTRQNPLPAREFYAKMRNGSMPTTSQVNPEEVREVFLKYMDQGYDVIHIAFSSGLSGSYNSARIAAQELLEERSDRKITVVDSLCASLGEGLIVHKALMLKENGASYEEVVEWLEKNKLNVVHNFTVDDLFHLYRGGRVSKAAALLGTMIQLKPVLHVDNSGHLIPINKVRGRKKSLSALVDSMEKQIGSYTKENDMVFISHGDCLEDAEFVKSMIEERLGIHKFMIHMIGTTVGAHAGPGTVALFYMGDAR